MTPGWMEWSRKVRVARSVGRQGRRMLGMGLVLWALGSGCATAHGSQGAAAGNVESGGMVRVVLVSGVPAEDEPLVNYAVAEGLRCARRWGELQQQVVVRVHPSHAALEAAAHQADVPWMRGWARFDEIELEAPSNWGGHRNPANVVELLRHELTHVIMYQNVASRETWMDVEIPLWFREGMASVTSQQGYRRMSNHELASWLVKNPNHDPWVKTESFSAKQQPVVYGAAHRAFERLLDRAGDQGVKRLMAAIYAGRTFDQAFAESIGSRPLIFLVGFRTELEQSMVKAPDPKSRPSTTLTSIPSS